MWAGVGMVRVGLSEGTERTTGAGAVSRARKGANVRRALTCSLDQARAEAVWPGGTDARVCENASRRSTL